MKLLFKIWHEVRKGNDTKIARIDAKIFKDNELGVIWNLDKNCTTFITTTNCKRIFRTLYRHLQVQHLFHYFLQRRSVTICICSKISGMRKNITRYCRGCSEKNMSSTSWKTKKRYIKFNISSKKQLSVQVFRQCCAAAIKICWVIFPCLFLLQLFSWISRWTQLKQNQEKDSEKL